MAEYKSSTFVQQSRRQVFLKMLLTLALAFAGANMTTPRITTAQHIASPSQVPIVGADISFTLQQEAVNNHLSDDGKTLPIENILTNNGVNYARLRLWVDPEAKTNDLESMLLLAQRYHDAGLKLLLSLHYSDTWADVNNQKIPSAWANLDYKELVQKVELYTHDVVQAFARQGTPVSIVQIGNEATGGILWPWGKIKFDWGDWWDGFAGLYKAGVAGARAGNPSAPPQIMIHVHSIDQRAVVDFLDSLIKYEMPFDLIGLTYYPWWNGPMGLLARNLDVFAARYRKDIIIAETSYPWTLKSGDSGSNVVSSPNQLPAVDRYPPTPSGQAAYYRALRKVLANVEYGHGAGYFVWEPGWLPGLEVQTHAHQGYSNLTLFDWEGRGLPALHALNPRREIAE
jgi:arabinogalactan endo-1,4-beta-galactosidase